MRKRNLFLLLLVLAISMSLLFSCGNNKSDNNEEENVESVEKEESKEPTELIISAAASLTDVLEELKTEYIKENSNVDIKYTFDSSGTLQAQIEEGAPADIFFSAAEKQMNALEEKDLILDGSRKTMLINKVVLIVPKDSELKIESLEDLKNDDIKKIAIGDDSVPVGQYSREIFENLNLTDALMPKAVNASNVRQVLTWVETGEADCGLVYATDAYTTEDVKIVLEAPEDSHKTVTYPVAIVKDSKNSDEAKKFLEFLSSATSTKAFEKYGFTVK